MLRNLVFALACVCPGMAWAEQVVPLTIGGTEIRVAVDDDYLRMSEKLPMGFAMESAVAPKSNRLVEGFISQSDAKLSAMGLARRETLFEVHVLRDMEGLDFTQADWQQARAAIAKSMGALDTKAIVEQGQPSANQRMSETMGRPVAVSFGAVGKPVVYGDDPASVRFVVLMSVTLSANGKSTPVQLETAGAIVRLSNKLVWIYANRRHVEGDDTTAVRAALDHFAERAIALNQAPAVAAEHVVTGR